VFRFLDLTGLILFLGGFVVAQTPSIGGCQVFPSNNVWNTAIDTLPAHANSAAYLATIGTSSPLHPDFGSDPNNGIPVNIVNGSQAAVTITFHYGGDPGPYPIPANPWIEGNSDHHLLILDTANCTDYEIFAAAKNSNGSWSAGSGAVFPLTSNQLRPAGMGSADAAGLPILPGLIKYDEVAAGAIHHAIRFTAPMTDNRYVWPARAEASSNSGAQYPPMGTRFRLKASFNVTGFSATNQVILNAMKKYGIILADNGPSWFIGGEPDTRWNDDDLHNLTHIRGSNFEAVDESSLIIDPNSAQARQPGTSSPAGGVITNQWVSLVSENSGMCLQVMGAAALAGFQQQPCSGAASQRFMLKPVTGGYEITVQSSGLQLDIRGGPGAIANGVPVIQFAYWGGMNEIWNVVPAKTQGYYQFQPVSSGSCLDVAGISVTAGAEVWQWACVGGENQAWKFQP
jgi:hypothetical protein